MTDHTAYFEYLQGRGRLGYLYRTRYLYPRLFRHLHGRVLDVGCGIGDLLHARPNTVGVDVNPSAVAWCRQRGWDARPMAPDHLPFTDGEFEGAILDNVLEHIPNPLPLLAELYRVMLPGGTLIIGVPGPRGFARDADHKVYYDERALIEVLDGAGFNPEHVLHMPVRSRWLEHRLPQYCVYGVFRRG
jgi:SAM-dependent methyltransferase